MHLGCIRGHLKKKQLKFVPINKIMLEKRKFQILHYSGFANHRQELVWPYQFCVCVCACVFVFADSAGESMWCDLLSGWRSCCGEGKNINENVDKKILIICVL